MPGRPRAYVNNFVSGNVSVLNLANDTVIDTIRTSPLPAAGSQEEINRVGAEVFFSSRGQFNRPANATVSTDERLSSEGWQSCSSCHFKGLTDGVIWQFGTGPRKSVPLNATFNPNDRAQQRVLNYSAIFDEVQDFDGEHPQRLRARARWLPRRRVQDPAAAAPTRRRSTRTTAC